jgi:Domain of unknown function (DU1801)
MRVPKPRPEYLKFLSAYEPRITELALVVRKLVLEEAPEAIELIYDAYSAVTVGYSFTGRPSDAFIHIAAYARWVNLGFNFGSHLEDPQKVLQGTGQWIRHIRIADPADAKDPVLRALVKNAIAQADRPDPKQDKPGTASKSIVRAIYARKRRPV